MPDHAGREQDDEHTAQQPQRVAAPPRRGFTRRTRRRRRGRLTRRFFAFQRGAPPPEQPRGQGEHSARRHPSALRKLPHPSFAHGAITARLLDWIVGACTRRKPSLTSSSRARSTPRGSGRCRTAIGGRSSCRPAARLITSKRLAWTLLRQARPRAYTSRRCRGRLRRASPSPPSRSLPPWSAGLRFQPTSRARAGDSEP